MRRAPAVLCLAVAACAHDAAFRPGDYGPDGPAFPGTVTRLTFSPAADRTPSWASDGATVWYTFTRTDRPDRDQCLGRLPAAGGARLETLCPVGLAAEDSTNVLEAPSEAGDGRLAYVHVNGRIGARTPEGGEVVVRPRGGAPARVLRLPNGPPGQRGYDRAASIQWVGDTLVFVSQFWIYFEDRLNGITDTIESGFGIEMVPPGDTAPLRVPNTDWASSVTLGDTAGVLYYTVNGDSRVIRHDLATGDSATIYDFGGLGIARDVQVRAGRLVAVVGGDVTSGFDAAQGAVIQRDDGGYLYLVELASGARAQLADTGFRFRRPALSRDGRRIIAEARAAGGPDLWLLELP